MRIKNVHISPGCQLKSVRGGNLEMQNCYLGRNVTIVSIKEILISDYVQIAEGVIIRDQDHAIKKDKLISESGFHSGEILIGANCWIGANAVVMRGTIMEENSVLGALSFLKNKYVFRNQIYAGSPAKLINK